MLYFKKLDDTAGPVRDSAAEAIGTAMKVVGERAMGAYIEGLDKIKQDKVKFRNYILKAKYYLILAIENIRQALLYFNWLFSFMLVSLFPYPFLFL